MSSDLTIAAKMMKTETGSQHHSMSQVWNVLNEEDWDYLHRIDRAINECQDAPDLYLITAICWISVRSLLVKTVADVLLTMAALSAHETSVSIASPAPPWSLVA